MPMARGGQLAACGMQLGNGADPSESGPGRLCGRLALLGSMTTEPMLASRSADVLIALEGSEAVVRNV